MVTDSRCVLTMQELLALSQKHPSVTVLQFDVKDYASHGTLAKQVEEAVGDAGLDVLINNAGIYNKVSLESGSPELIVENVEVNAVAPFFLTRTFLPLLRRSAKHMTGGRKTVIVNITSKMGSIADNTFGGHYAYRSSKVSGPLLIRLSPDRRSCRRR